MPPIISFIGPHNVGKTTLLEKVVSCLASRGFRVGMVKHAFHAIDLGDDGKDSVRLFNAGAATMVVSSGEMMVEYRRLSGEMSPHEIFDRIGSDVDIIIAEGYKKERLPKIEVLRQGITDTPLAPENLVAMVSDFTIEGAGVPVFNIDDVQGLTEFIVQSYLQAGTNF